MLGHVIAGAGKRAVIVLHEWLGNHSNYAAIIPYLDAYAFTYAFADLRGYGLSREIAGTYGLEEAATDVLALADFLGFHRFHLVGHSMSGLIAQYLTSIAADRLESVVCVSSVPATGFKTDENGLAALRSVIRDDGALRRAIDARTSGRYAEGWVTFKQSMARETKPEAMEGYLAMFTGSNISARMTGSAVPLTLITGAQDIPFYRREHLEPLFRSWFPALHAHEIEDAGHYAMLETPPLFAALMERGLSAIR